MIFDEKYHISPPKHLRKCVANAYTRHATCYTNDYFSLSNILYQKELEVPIVHIPSLAFLQHYFSYLKQRKLIQYGSLVRQNNLVYFIRRVQYQKAEMTLSQQQSVEYLLDHIYWPIEIGIHSPLPMVQSRAQQYWNVLYFLRYAPNVEMNQSMLEELIPSPFNPTLLSFPFANWVLLHISKWLWCYQRLE